MNAIKRIAVVRGVVFMLSTAFLVLLISTWVGAGVGGAFNLQTFATVVLFAGWGLGSLLIALTPIFCLLKINLLQALEDARFDKFYSLFGITIHSKSYSVSSVYVDTKTETVHSSEGATTSKHSRVVGYTRNGERVILANSLETWLFNIGREDIVDPTKRKKHEFRHSGCPGGPKH